MNDALHMFSIVCAGEELSRFISQVGVGSKEQCFAGDMATILAISVGVTGLRTSRIGICRHSIVAFVVLNVNCLIFSIFPWKNATKSSALQDCSSDGGASCKSELTFDYSNLELVKFAFFFLSRNPYTAPEGNVEETWILASKPTVYVKNETDDEHIPVGKSRSWQRDIRRCTTVQTDVVVWSHFDKWHMNVCE